MVILTVMMGTWCWKRDAFKTDIVDVGVKSPQTCHTSSHTTHGTQVSHIQNYTIRYNLIFILFI